MLKARQENVLPKSSGFPALQQNVAAMDQDLPRLACTILPSAASHPHAIKLHLQEVEANASHDAAGECPPRVDGMSYMVAVLHHKSKAGREATEMHTHPQRRLHFKLGLAL